MRWRAPLRWASADGLSEASLSSLPRFRFASSLLLLFSSLLSPSRFRYHCVSHSSHPCPPPRYTGLQFANSTKYGVIELPPALQEASAIVETLTLWAFLQSPGLILLCKGRILRGAAFLFALAAEATFIIVPIMAELAYAIDQSEALGDLARRVYAEFTFYVVTLVIAALELVALCCCGNSD